MENTLQRYINTSGVLCRPLLTETYLVPVFTNSYPTLGAQSKTGPASVACYCYCLDLYSRGQRTFSDFHFPIIPKIRKRQLPQLSRMVLS